MTPATATLALKFCEAVFAACPWVAPATWTPRQTFEDLLNQMDEIMKAPAPWTPRQTFEDLLNQMTRNTDAPRP